jgi:protein MpaA
MNDTPPYNVASQGKTYTLGYSQQGQPIELVCFNATPSLPLPLQNIPAGLTYATSNTTAQPIDVLYIGAFHGDEPESSQILQHFLGVLPQHLALLSEQNKEGLRVMVLPTLNPDGLLAGTRKNANHVDLNRNWPTHNWEVNALEDPYHSGPHPASECETRLLQALIEAHPPQCIVSLHTPYRCINYDGPALALAQAYAQHCGYPVEASIGYPTPGSFGTWAGIERGIPVLTVELPDNQPLEQTWAENHPALEAMLLLAVQGGEL